MAGLNRLARRAAFGACLAIVAAMATAAPLKPAAADDWRNYGRWHGGGYGHGERHGDRDWRHGGYGGGGYFAYRGPTYYYAPPPAYYYPPPPVYYQPAPVYGPPGISLNFVIPLQFR